MKQLLNVVMLLLLFNNSSAQNVGIGVPIPTEKLQVAGNIKADTLKPNALKLMLNAGTGKVLTSDAEGNANWQVNGNTGFGVWGDCATNGNISEYNPVVDETGAIGDDFGFAVSISNNFAIIGAYSDQVGANVNQGSASIYQYNGTNWILMQKITDATGAAGDSYGFSVSISGNYAILGAYADDVGANANQGSVSIYFYNGTTWVLMQKITDPAGIAGDQFGVSVCISGNYAIVGTSGSDVGANVNQGSGSIYFYNGITWVLMQKITDATGAASDFFGTSVSLSGNYAILGAEGDNVGANTDQGSANIYRYNGTSWILMNKITDATGTPLDYFGGNVSISGNYAIVGSRGDDVGVNNDQGSSSIYFNNGSAWVLMQKLTEATGSAGDNFGTCVSISGNYATVGASFDDVGTNLNQGTANIYQRVGLGWQKLQYLTDPAGNADDYFGSSTAIDGINKRFLNGAYGYAGSSGKVVFGKVN